MKFLGNLQIYKLYMRPGKEGSHPATDWWAWATHFGGGPAIPAHRFHALQQLEGEWLRAAIDW